MNRKELANLSTELKTIGVQLIVDKKGVLPSFARAGFDPTNGKLYLRKGATHFEAFHETQHAKQWAALGILQYNKQSRFEREKYVFDRIIENRESFSESEIKAATNYIESLT
jgi:type I restriction-modification system DNA methylase subunit